MVWAEGITKKKGAFMKVELPYGDENLVVEVPDRAFMIPNTHLAKLDPIEDLEGAVREALAHPLESPPISGLVKPGARVTIAFDDATVPAFGPIRRVAIEALLGELESAGVKRETVTLLCANALHRKFSPEELASIIGKELVEEFGERLLCHDAEDGDNLVYLGQTEHGYDVEVSRYVTDSDLLVYLNAAHHRGFSGGWKSVCVGLSTYRSIRHHHTPDGMSMSTHENRMHKMLDEMGAFLESKVDTKFFKIDTIETNPFESAHIFAGSTWATRKAALEILSELFPPRRSLSAEKYDVVLYGVPSWSPYAIFSFMNPLLTLVSSGLGYLGGTIRALGKPGCTVILATPCPNVWDEVHHAAYPEVWNEVLPVTRDPYEIESKFAEHYATHEGYIDKYRNHYAFHPIHAILATHPLKRLKHASRVIVAGMEDPSVGHHLGFETAATVEEALGMAEDVHGKGYSIACAQSPAAMTKVAM